ncbi:hypothetical protein Vretimale_14160, partial [Volvox reticuliferus]
MWAPWGMYACVCVPTTPRQCRWQFRLLPPVRESQAAMRSPPSLTRRPMGLFQCGRSHGITNDPPTHASQNPLTTVIAARILAAAVLLSNTSAIVHLPLLCRRPVTTLLTPSLLPPPPPLTAAARAPSLPLLRPPLVPPLLPFVAPSGEVRV